MKSTTAISLEKVLNGCKKGQRSSQKELYKHFYSYGMSIAIRYVGSRDEAVEIMNDAFLKVFKNIDAYNPEFPFKSWFRKILVNTAINSIKKTGKLQYVSIEDNAFELQASDNPFGGVDYEELLNMVQELPPAYRTVFNLQVIEGYKHEEIAEMLGISVGTSKSNLSKAKEKLRAKLNAYFLDDVRSKKG